MVAEPSVAKLSDEQEKARFYEIFGGRLRELRESLGISQNRFAWHLGLTQAAIQKYETGQMTPTSWTLWRICDCYGASADWLLGFDDQGNMPTVVDKSAREDPEFEPGIGPDHNVGAEPTPSFPSEPELVTPEPVDRWENDGGFANPDDGAGPYEESPQNFGGDTQGYSEFDR